jgi:tetratricopeptide (TPR) repeat protein
MGFGRGLERGSEIVGGDVEGGDVKAVVALPFVLAACSAPAALPELAEASARQRRGEVDGAVRAYRDAQESCRAVKPARRQREACTEAQLGEAETLEAAQRAGEARAAYRRIAAAPASDEAAATACLRLGRLELAGGDEVAAWRAWWRCVTEWPDEPSAGDALRELVSDGRGRDARALVTQMGEVLTVVAQSQVADNLVWWMAELSEREMREQETARALYDRLPRDYPMSGMRDDARWHAARISRELGDGRGAAERLRGLLATREVALGAGSYFSIWLDDAQLELGKVLRDELGDRKGAAAAFRRLERDYPASTLIDDATWELARTLHAGGDKPGTCAALGELARRFEDSRHAEAAKALGAEAGCAPRAVEKKGEP